MSDLFSIDGIIDRAEKKWNSRNKSEKKRYTTKYNHILIKVGGNSTEWNDDFFKLCVPQRNILIKGELIRTYDSLPNSEKTKIKEKYNLSRFSSKWYRMLPRDKNKLLRAILDDQGRTI